MTIKRDAFSGNTVLVYYVIAEIAVGQFHSCTIATVQFHVFLATRLRGYIFCTTFLLYFYGTLEISIS